MRNYTHRKLGLRTLAGAIIALLTGAVLVPLGAAAPAVAATAYYVSSSSGSDSNSGTSPSTPWQTFSKVNSYTTYGPGDQILLKSGDTWTGQTLAPNGSGTAANPILISNFGAGALPKINRNDPTNLSSRGILITDDDGIKITNLEVSGAFYGILFEYGPAASGFDYVWVEDVYIHDMAAKQETYGDPWAIGIGVISWNTAATQVLRDITIRDISSERVTAAVWIGKRIFDAGLGRDTVSNDTDKTNYSNVDILNVTATQGRSLQVVTQNATDVLWDNIQVRQDGYSYPAGQGSAGSGLEHTQDVTIQNSDFGDISKGTSHLSGDGDGFDLEGDTVNSTFNNVYIHDSEGPGLLYYTGATGISHTNVVIADSVFNAKAWGATTPNSALWFSGTGNTGAITNTKFYLSAGEELQAGTSNVAMRGNTEVPVVADRR